MPSDPLRLFTGIALPESIRREMVRLQPERQANGPEPGIVWQQYRNLHFTLNFIGAVDRAELPALSEALAGIKESAFSLRLKGVGYFGSATRPRVLWAGVAASDALNQLQQQALHALKNAGFQPDERPYHPHVTLGRCDQGEQAAVAAVSWLNRHADYSGPAFKVDRFSLFASTRDAEGLRYDVIQTFALTPAG